MFTTPHRRRIPAVNASSMADIAFLLLVFFLVTTTIDIDKGIRVKLPPYDSQKPPPIHERNLFNVKINASNQLMIDGEPTNLMLLKSKTKQFILNPDNDPGLSVSPTQAIISLQNDRSTSYQTYLSVYNEIKAAYTEIREAEAQNRFGEPYRKLSRSKQEVIKKEIPLLISEGEVVDYEQWQNKKPQSE